MNFQINTVDLRQPSEFLKLGQIVPNTKFKLEKFEYKTMLNPSTGDEDGRVGTDLGQHRNQSEPVVLVLTKVTNSPDVLRTFRLSMAPAPAGHPGEEAPGIRAQAGH